MSMGAQVEERGGRGRRKRTRPVSEINVTPMVDVMLVLLVIFMITAPLLTVGVPVDLPQTQANAIRDPEEPISVSINAEGKVFLQDAEVDLPGLVPRLRAIAGTNPDLRIFVRGDRSVDYGRVMEVMGTINAGGFNKVALITAAPQDTPAKGRAKKK
jgi:biopolymer transport protein TolR